jgi:hypothetical protein
MDAGFVSIGWPEGSDGEGTSVSVRASSGDGAELFRTLYLGDRLGISWVEPNGAAARVIVTYHGNRSDKVDGFDPDVTMTCDGPVQMVAPEDGARVTFRTHAATVTVWGMDRRWRRETTDEPGAFEWTTTGPRFAKVLEVER